MLETTDNKKHIRHYHNEKSGTWYFSIVDVIEQVTDTSDARNYWKVLKNRLRKADNQLVTRCNQLKMMAKDGKYYMTDTADRETLIKILEHVPNADAEVFKLITRKKQPSVPLLLKEREFHFPFNKPKSIKTQCLCEEHRAF